MGDVLHSIVDLGYARYQGNTNKATWNIEFLQVYLHPTTHESSLH